MYFFSICLNSFNNYIVQQYCEKINESNLGDITDTLRNFFETSRKEIIGINHLAVAKFSNTIVNMIIKNFLYLNNTYIFNKNN